mmetsp:Transcript_1200/g.2396  ORF Transcript_1200/g.2396 Transcript_1200/m.2396 type:complete len:213 (+) Transcript_1200:560-1198(+)
MENRIVKDNRDVSATLSLLNFFALHIHTLNVAIVAEDTNLLKDVVQSISCKHLNGIIGRQNNGVKLHTRPKGPDAIFQRKGLRPAQSCQIECVSIVQLGFICRSRTIIIALLQGTRRNDCRPTRVQKRWTVSTRDIRPQTNTIATFHHPTTRQTTSRKEKVGQGAMSNSRFPLFHHVQIIFGQEHAVSHDTFVCQESMTVENEGVGTSHAVL